MVAQTPCTTAWTVILGVQLRVTGVQLRVTGAQFHITGAQLHIMGPDRGVANGELSVANIDFRIAPSELDVMGRAFSFNEGLKGVHRFTNTSVFIEYFREPGHAV